MNWPVMSAMIEHVTGRAEQIYSFQSILDCLVPVSTRLMGRSHILIQKAGPATAAIQIQKAPI